MSIPSLADLAVDSVVTQVIEQDPAHVFELLRKVRAGRPAGLLDSDVIEFVKSGELDRYRCFAKDIPYNSRLVLDELLRHRTMYGVRVPMGCPLSLDDIDAELHAEWEREIAEAVSKVFQVRIPTGNDMLDDVEPLYSNLNIPGLNVCVGRFARLLFKYQKVLQQGILDFIYPKDSLERFGADVFFDSNWLQALDLEKSLPSSFWMQWPLSRILRRRRKRNGSEESVYWDTEEEGDPTDPAAASFLKKCRYVFAILEMLEHVHDEILRNVVWSRSFQRVMQGGVHDAGLQAPVRAIVALHWGMPTQRE